MSYDKIHFGKKLYDDHYDDMYVPLLMILPGNFTFIPEIKVL